jgi:elongation factor 2 kinase
MSLSEQQPVNTVNSRDDVSDGDVGEYDAAIAIDGFRGKKAKPFGSPSDTILNLDDEGTSDVLRPGISRVSNFPLDDSATIVLDESSRLGNTRFSNQPVNESATIVSDHKNGPTNNQPTSNKPKKSKKISGAPRSTEWYRLKELQAVFSEGLITAEEFAERKKQLVDELTGTSAGGNTKTRYPRRKKEKDQYNNKPGVMVFPVPKPPPDFAQIAAETGLCYIFDIHKGKWDKKEVKVKIDHEPFARGTLRRAYHISGLEVLDGETSEKGHPKKTYVAKMSIDPFETPEAYVEDVKLQIIARECAKNYNSHFPPKRINFVGAYLLELVDRPQRPLCCVERFIAGPYRKHNNNYGFVDDDERSTPQAFSHFTFESSDRKFMVVDIQGVGDLYTDPQIHSYDEDAFGKGNMGKRGIDKFLSTHRCNPICRYFRLPPHNGMSTDVGTLPASAFMPQDSVNIVKFRFDNASEGPQLSWSR